MDETSCSLIHSCEVRRDTLRCMRILLLLLVLSPFVVAQQRPAAIPPTFAPAAKKKLASDLGPVPSKPVATTPVPAMSPSTAYLYALQPFNNAREASGDLTDADQWALGIGIARAKQQCDLLAKQKVEDEALLSLGKLCIFGQDFMAAREALISYLELPKLKSPEVGRLLLARAFLGLKWVTSAESQVDSLLSMFPYDASTNLAIDMVVDAAQASESAADRAVIGRLDALQLPHILEALAQGGSLSGNGDSVDAAMLVRDALRGADRLRRRGQFDDAEKIVDRVEALIAAPSIADSAYAPAIHNALARYHLYAQASPVREFHGLELPIAGQPVAHRILLYDPNPAAHRTVLRQGRNMLIRMSDDRTLVLVFSLAGPASVATIQSVMKDLGEDHVIPGLNVIAVTSYAANTGDDTSDPQVLQYIRALRAELPRQLPVLVVSNTELKPFAIDMWPAAILLDGHGHVLWLNTLSGSQGSIRGLEWDMENFSPLPPAA